MLIPVVPLQTAIARQEIQQDTLTHHLSRLSEVTLDGSQAVEAAPYKEFLRECSCRVGPYTFSPSFEAETDAIVAWLDSGARRAIIKVDVSNPSTFDQFAAWAEQLPASRHRLVAAFRLRDLRSERGSAEGVTASARRSLEGAMNQLRPVVSCIQVDFEQEYAVAPMILEELKALRGKEGSPDYVEVVFTRTSGAEGGKHGALWTPEEIGELHMRAGVHVQCPARLDLASERRGGLDDTRNIDAVEAFIACLRTDREDGLIATVVCDTMGIALGLVYSNSASIRASITSGRGVYWSRSRAELWRKGDTSGAWQELRRVEVDCDSDAMKYTVWQHGDPAAFCHFNRRNCWAEERGCGHLERTLAKRKEEAPPGSYTKRLFEDPVLLRNKLVEEAQELAEAESASHVAAEAADLMYFLMVRCAAAGVHLEDVEQELDMRSLKLKRRPGNAKEERITAGDRILEERRQKAVPNPL